MEAFSKNKSCADNLNVPVTFMSCGTDGQDGPCPVGGVWMDLHNTEKMSGTLWKKFEDARENNDSFVFFSENLPENLINTGLTFTNVMDVHLIYFTP